MKLNFTKIFTVSLLFLFVCVNAQIKQVKGKITDDKGKALSNVTVSTSDGEISITDSNGNYEISAQEGTEISYDIEGFEMKHQKVGESNLVNITMKSTTSKIAQNKELDEVVVTALGIKRQAKSLGYGATIIDGNKLKEVSNSNPFESLSGKIAGVDISAPAQPGGTIRINVRGFTSPSNSGQPLIVIDGTPMLNTTNGSTNDTQRSNNYDAGNSFGDIDPNIIESMNFLKGAAATNLYGKDGANGVIIITTKRGKNKLKVDISSAIDFAEVAKVPEWQYDFGQGWSGENYSTVKGEGQSNSNENGSWGPKFDGKIRPWGRIYNNSQQIKPYVGLKDNLKEFFDIGQTNTNSVNISGGSDNANGALSFSNVNSDGIFPTDRDQYNRKTFGFNGGLTFDNLRVKVNGNYVTKNQNAIPTGQGDDASFGATPWQELLQVPSDISLIDLKDQNNIFNTPSYFYTPYSANPYTTINSNKIDINKERFFGNVNLSYDLTSKLTASLQIGADYENEYVKQYGAIIKYLPNSPQSLAVANTVKGGVKEKNITNSLYDSYLSLNYNISINKNWVINSALGFGYSQQNKVELSAQVTGLLIPEVYELFNSADLPKLEQFNVKKRYMYLYGLGEVSYKNRYFLTVSARNDWSSSLAIQNYSFFYPSVSLSTILLDNQNFLKLRGSWAQAGNDLEPYKVYSEAGQAENNGYFGILKYPFNGLNAYEYTNRIDNLNIKNELTSEFEIGLEGKFFNKRVGFDLALYDKTINDVLLEIRVPRSTGFSNKFGNFATTNVKGIELALDLYPVRTEKFKWNFSYTFSKNKGKVKDIEGSLNEIILRSSAYGVTYRFVEGDEIGTFYAKVPKMTEDGKYIVNELGYYSVTDKEEKIGSSQRDFIMGFGNKFTYKNLSLSFNVDWKQGGKMYSYTKRLSYFDGNAVETTYNDRNSFVIPNSVQEIFGPDGKTVIGYKENSTPISFENITKFYNTQNNPGIEKDHVIDKTFIRLRDVSLSFNFPKQWIESIRISSASFTIYGKNLYLWTPSGNSYVDPEVSNYGTGLNAEFGEFGVNPSQRTYGMMFRFSF